jgi:hypothetical protein
MNRRKFLMASAAYAATPNGYQAVYFDGKTYAINPGTDSSLALPASATAGLIAYNFRADPRPLYPYGVVCGVFNPNATGPGAGLWILHSTTSSALYIELVVTQPKSNALGLGGWAKIPRDRAWHQPIVAFDTTTALIQIVVDGQSLPITYDSATNNLGTVNFGVPILIGAQDGPKPHHPAFAYAGDLADIWASFGTPIDATDPRVNFYDPENGVAVYNSPDGLNAIPGIRPNFFLSGDPGKFLLNRPTSIGKFSWTSANSQSPFTIGAGQLLESDSDPFVPSETSTSASPRRLFR